MPGTAGVFTPNQQQQNKFQPVYGNAPPPFDQPSIVYGQKQELNFMSKNDEQNEK